MIYLFLLSFICIITKVLSTIDTCSYSYGEFVQNYGNIWYVGFTSTTDLGGNRCGKSSSFISASSNDALTHDSSGEVYTDSSYCCMCPFGKMVPPSLLGPKEIFPMRGEWCNYT